jgi:hypothetical protein
MRRKTLDNQSAIQLGLTMFLMTVLLHYGTRRILDFGLVTRCFRVVAEHAPETQSDEINLWLLVIGGIWTSHHASDDWLDAQIKTSIERLCISKWQEVRAAMQKLPWISGLARSAWRDILERHTVWYLNKLPSIKLRKLCSTNSEFATK